MDLYRSWKRWPWAVPAVAGDGVPREESSHPRRDGNLAGLEEQMHRVGHEGPGVAGVPDSSFAPENVLPVTEMENLEPVQQQVA